MWSLEFKIRFTNNHHPPFGNFWRLDRGDLRGARGGRGLAGEGELRTKRGGKRKRAYQQARTQVNLLYFLSKTSSPRFSLL